MRRSKKLLLAVLVLVLLSQAPFAYRRYRLSRLSQAIQQINSQRMAPQPSGEFVEYKGVVHVHSFLGGHSEGNFEQIIAAAKANPLNFVVMTEHTSGNFNTAAMTLKGEHAGVLFINGNEVSTINGDRLLVVPGDESATGNASGSTSDVIAKEKARAALAFVAYPGEFKSWDTGGYDGVEVYNVYTNTKQISPLLMFFDGLWSYRSYPDLLFANFYSRPSENLAKWDQAIANSGRKLVALAGNDAHANVGFKLEDSSGETLLGMQLDPYERSFRLVRVHVMIPRDKALSQESLLEALGKGHCFIGFDLFGDTTGFSFTASNGQLTAIQGDDITGEDLHLVVNSPVDSARIVLLKDGRIIRDDYGVSRKEYPVREKGSYRVEVYLPGLPKPVNDKPWIISNPIYVK